MVSPCRVENSPATLGRRIMPSPQPTPSTLPSPSGPALRLHFVQGADVIAPGLSRAQMPLLRALRALPGVDVRAHTFPTVNARALFPYMYGPLPVSLLASRPHLVHIASSPYAHVVPLLRAPTVVTCYDLVELEDARERGHTKPHREFHLRATLRGLSSARQVVASSHATARSLLRYLPEIEDRLAVIYCALPDAFLHAPPALASPSRPPYALYVGSEQPRKNLPRLLEALAQVRITHPELHFVKVGAHQTPAGRAALEQVLLSTGLRSVTTIRDTVTDSELMTLYRGAAFLIQPSLREGFGYPPLEALALGCPVIVSNRDSLPEVTGGRALVVDPLDVRDMAAAMRAILSSDATRREVGHAGPAWVRRYSEAVMVEAYLNVYNSLVG